MLLALSYVFKKFQLYQGREAAGVFNWDYYSFKIFLRFWLAKSTRIIHHIQLLLTKFGRILSYWTDDVKSAAKVADYHYGIAPVDTRR